MCILSADGFQGMDVLYEKILKDITLQIKFIMF